MRFLNQVIKFTPLSFVVQVQRVSTVFLAILCNFSGLRQIIFSLKCGFTTIKRKIWPEDALLGKQLRKKTVCTWKCFLGSFVRSGIYIIFNLFSFSINPWFIKNYAHYKFNTWFHGRVKIFDTIVYLDLPLFILFGLPSDMNVWI